MQKKRKILHILKDAADAYPLEVIRKTAVSCDLSILLIQEAVHMNIPKFQGNIFVLSEDLNPKKQSPFQSVGYQKMLELIFESDSVVTW